ncbi:hypothetical protein AAZX31_09G086300 [Glycine max]|uniref:SAM domain-containing protein n=2 Tax=Glycine subgen. Soja TaxID=1462606 RepID=I1L287_SOYBN|nr:bromodomain and WD repeat-containing DDB_G0285837 [Glycine max]XP_028180287.1 bromodomain and WD repeat-containing DDB_G0285837-like [Glycine soja]KAH1042218.1 hypothetical protein GYH30_024502 [Glycine max]KAH1232702.1 hypothetical protein GmHk_09G025289 [Glycine max]KRH37823.1 hypothetical protein GLYMA_09G091800v4 [Glycine max]RZB91304.1 hypothetical protein D0Y65_023634 [Glycine soja]|eukprot:XP_003533859.1 bromodomain and WD repeat-containing DDB_G0285837 [Glycine max]
MDWFSWLSRTSLEPSLIYEYGLAFARNELQLEDAIYFNHEFLQSMGVSIAKHRLEIIKLAKKEVGGGGAVMMMRSSSSIKFSIKKCLRKCFSKLVSREDHHEAMMATTAMMATEPNWYQGKWRRARHNGNNEDLKGDNNNNNNNNNKGVQRSRTIALSGPLDGNGRIIHEKMMNNNKVMKLSGPLDGKMNGGNNERVNMYASANRSPLMSANTPTRPLDGRFMGSVKSPRLSGPLDARPTMVNSRSPRLTRPLDDRTESPMGYSPYNKVRADAADYDDDYAMWPTLFEDLKPT